MALRRGRPVGDLSVILLGSVIPPGTVAPFAGGTVPDGWLLCDGSTIDRTTYSALFTAIGQSAGQGDGSTTFNLPDYRGRFLRGVDGTAGRDPDKASRTAMNTGGNTGNNVNSIQNDDLKSHNHVSGLSIDASGAVTPRYGKTNTGIGSTHFDTGGAGSTTWGQNTSSVGGNETRPLNANVNYIIKV